LSQSTSKNRIKIMKQFAKSMLAVVGIGALLFGCQPDGIKPSDKGGNGVAGSAGDAHPALDTVCKYSDTVFFKSNDGSLRVNKCGWETEEPQPITCVDPQEKWGYFQMYNGYTMGAHNTHWLDISFALNYGWYCDFNHWLFKIAGGIIIDPNTGKPGTGGVDWSHAQYNPLLGEWKVQVLVSAVPSPCFDLACKLSVAPVDVNGGPIESYRTDLWASNRNWNKPGHPEQSNNEYVIHYCPLGCLETTPPPVVTNECVFLQVGAPALANCATLNAGAVSGATYNWSNGAQTQSISVCPTATTNYSVSISQGTTVTAIKNYTVNYQNVRCTAGNSPLHKVRVCHRPPGNPTNVQNICIDWSGVPAHVARFRPAGSTQGHDSGCEIGNSCNGNPCAN
jgi:hypothetical protein